MLNIDNKISLLPIWCHMSKPLCNLNKQHFDSAKFYINNAPSIGNQSAICQ